MRMFRFLKKGDCGSILTQATLQRYQAGEMLLEEGSDDKHLFLLKRGQVCVQHTGIERGVELAYMHAGDIFGEMSFVDGEYASASVIACDTVDVLSISHKNVDAIVQSDPDFYVRFYKSLADILAQRLCETTSHATAAPAWDEQMPYPKLAG